MTKELNATVAERLAAALQRHGVDVMFSQSIPSTLILAAEDSGIRQIVYRAENAGGAMADGYARATGRIGVVTAQNGPAATLLVAPFAEALKASIPLLGLVQDVDRPSMDRNAFQEFDHFKLFDGCAKWVRRLTDPARVDDYLDMAIQAATSGRPGPVVLLLPVDLLNQPAEAPRFARTATLGEWPLDRFGPDPSRIAAAADLLATAERPVILAGGGIHASQAANELAALQDFAHLPVGYTMMGKGSVSDLHPLTLGLMANVVGKRSLGRHARALVDEADVILLVGNRTNQNGTNSWTSIPEGARIIHVDVDGQELGRTYEPAVRLLGDAKLTLSALTERLATCDLSKRRAARAAISERIAGFRALWADETKSVRDPGKHPIRPEQVMAAIDQQLPDDAILVADASYSSLWINAFIRARTAGQRFITPRGIAGLGWGYPMALGAQSGRPGVPIICVVGDGGFGHCWSELETAARAGLPVKLIILNNSVLGFQKDSEIAKLGRYTRACHFNLVDHAAIARACGVEAQRIDDGNDVVTRLAEALAYDGPVLLDIITDPDAFPPISLLDALA